MGHVASKKMTKIDITHTTLLAIFIGYSFVRKQETRMTRIT
jgi:hypothetical protein